MRIFMTGGTGFVGAYLTRRFVQTGHEVVVLTRRGNSEEPLPPGISFLVGDPAIAGPWQEKISECDVVINLAGSSVFTRWNKETRREIVDSRILTTYHVVEALEDRRGKETLLISASAVGYYGNREDNTVLYEKSDPGNDFPAQLCISWESQADRARDFGVRVVRTRFGTVLGRGGGAFKKMLPAFRWNLGSPLGDGQQWFSWIHQEDLARIMLFLIDRPNIKGSVNCVAPTPVRNEEMTRTLAKALGKAVIAPNVPGFMLKLMLGDFAEFLLKGQRVIPKKLLDEGFRFHFPTIEEAFADLLGNRNWPENLCSPSSPDQKCRQPCS